MNEAFKKNIGIMNQSMINELESTLILLFGLGGVGGFAFETLIRVGIKNFIIVDKDNFEISNLNRQLASNLNTIGLKKVDVYKDRALRINDQINITSIYDKIDTNNINNVFKYIKDFNNIKNIFVADCIDDVNAKIEIIKKCHSEHLNLISSMGTANHNDTSKIKISKLQNTRYCPLAKKIRTALKYDKTINPTVLYIDEEPIDISKNVENDIHISTIQYVPAICGMKIAEYIIHQLIFN